MELVDGGSVIDGATPSSLNCSLLGQHRWPVYEITVAPSLRPPGTLLKRLRNINTNVYTQFKHASRHPRVSATKRQMKQGKKYLLKCGLRMLIRWLV